MKQRGTNFLPGVYIGVIGLLLLVGLLFVFESSGPDSFLNHGGDTLFLFNQQLQGIAIGIVLFFLALLIPSKIYVRFAPLLFIGGLLLLAATLIPGIGLKLNGARRWLNLGFMVVQPVELMKFALIAFMASWLTRQQRVQTFLLTLGLPGLLVILQPDMGSALVLSGIAVLLYIVGGGSYKHLGLVLAGLIPLALLLVVVAPYRMQRLTTFLNPSSDPQGAGYHVRQLTLALGRGGVFGQGIGNSSQKFSYVPEASTDSIAAIIGEEVGFFGLALIIGLYVVLFKTALVMSKNLNGPQQLLAYGIVIWVAVQLLLNLAAVSALAPLTGVPLPLISYGRTSLIALLFALGVLLRLYLEDQKSSLR